MAALGESKAVVNVATRKPMGQEEILLHGVLCMGTEYASLRGGQLDEENAGSWWIYDGRV